jgi:hypothetical protein
MPTVIIRKHPTQNAIQVEPEVAVLRPDEKLTFKISSENGFETGTRVGVKFQKRYRVVPMLELSGAADAEPFASRETRAIEEEGSCSTPPETSRPEP